MNGIIVVNKEKNMTSRDVVNIACKCLKTKKIGHTGTLDPLATGVLVLCVGKATKLVDFITSYKKEYIAEVKLGIFTDTLDISGKVLKREVVSDIPERQIKNVLKTFIGEINQEVPKYSAIKVNGKKLYQYARENIEVELPIRKVNIYELELISKPIYQDDTLTFKIRCLVSKGTYIRSLIRDISYKLNTIGVMSDLVRTKQGNFLISSACSIDDIKNFNFKFIKIEDVLNDFPKIIVNSEIEKKVRNGNLIENIYNNDIAIFNDEKEILAIYTVYEKDKKFMKPKITFFSNN